MSEEFRIYVACLAAYNNGKLHGAWIDATDDIDDIQDQINEMLESSPEELTEETTQIPEHLAFDIDYEKIGRDMELSGDLFTIETGYQEVHIFWNH